MAAEMAAVPAKRPSKGAKKASARDKQIESLERQIKACRKDMVNGFRGIDKRIDGEVSEIDVTTIASTAKAFELGLPSNGILPRLEALEMFTRRAEVYVPVSSLKRSLPSAWQRFKSWLAR